MSKNTSFSKSDVVGVAILAVVATLAISISVNLIINRINETPGVWLVASPSDHIIYDSYTAGAKPVGVLEDKMVVELDSKLYPNGIDWIKINENQWIQVNENVDMDVWGYLMIVFPEGTKIYDAPNGQELDMVMTTEKVKVIAVTNKYFIAYRKGQVVYIKR